MSVTHFEVTRRSPYPFDYERVDGVLHFAVDPAHPANSTIVDLDCAPRDGGRVRFQADLVLLRPLGQSNRRLLSFVVNRGQRTGVPLNRFAARPPTLPITDEIDVGDGFLMRRGWTVAMCGWQWDVERQPGLTGLDAPQAVGPDGAPLRGRVSMAFQPNEPHPAHLLSHWPLHPRPGRQTLRHQPYPAADLHEQEAELRVRDGANGPWTTVPRASWRFAREEAGAPVDDDAYVWLADGFEPGRWYEVTYTTRSCPVVGTGLLAIRDSTSWLRFDGFGGPIEYAYGFGISQCGRFLRQFVYDGLNRDEQGRQVFDGLLPHVAGARRGEFNVRHGQPSETNPRGAGSQPPYTSDQLLARQRALGGLPRIFTTNTASEYWRSDCSLIHTDASATRDVEPPAEERMYLIAGHQHGPGVALVNDTTPIGARGANNFNTVDGSSVIRAFLINLDDWVSRGIEPPPNAIPRLADGTAVAREAVLEQLASLPGLALLDSGQLPRLPGADGQSATSYASAVDADGNEIAGIRLPELSVPVATHMGWVARHPAVGGAGQVLDMMGASLPFAATESERAQTGDPRLSIGARYRDRQDYVARVRAAAAELARQRYILDEDVDLVIELAAQRYDLFAAQPVIR